MNFSTVFVNMTFFNIVDIIFSFNSTFLFLQISIFIIERFKNLDKENERARTEQSFFVPKEDIVGNDYDLSINKYKQTEYVAVEYPSTQEIMTELDELEIQIGEEMEALRNLLGL